MNTLRHFAYPFPQFLQHGVKKSEIRPRFSTQVVFETLWFQNKATYPKSKTCLGSGDMIALYIDVYSPRR